MAVGKSQSRPQAHLQCPEFPGEKVVGGGFMKESATLLATHSELGSYEDPVICKSVEEFQESLQSGCPSSFACIYEAFPSSTAADTDQTKATTATPLSPEHHLAFGDGGCLSIVPTSASGRIGPGDKGLCEYLVFRDELEAIALEKGGGKIKGIHPLRAGDEDSANLAYKIYRRLAPPGSEAAKESSFIAIPSGQALASAASEESSRAAAFSLKPTAESSMTGEERFAKLVAGLGGKRSK